MKLKEWLEETKKKLGRNDSYTIFYIWRGRNARITNTNLAIHPMLMECDVVKEHNYETEFMSFTLSMKQTGQGKCMLYNCWLDNDQVRLATGWEVD